MSITMCPGIDAEAHPAHMKFFVGNAELPWLVVSKETARWLVRLMVKNDLMSLQAGHNLLVKIETFELPERFHKNTESVDFKYAYRQLEKYPPINTHELVSSCGLLALSCSKS